MSHQTFVPTIDISNNKAVLVKHGKVYEILGDPFEIAKFNPHKHCQIIDIDQAINYENLQNKELIKELVKRYLCYIGRGIRTLEDAYEFINSSARRK